MKILFIKLGKQLSDQEKQKIDIAIQDLYTNYLNYEVKAIHRAYISISEQPVFETTDFPQGKLSFLSGKTMTSIIDRIDTEKLAPIIVWIVDNQPKLTMANICYKLIRKYGIVNCSVISDNSLEHYIIHEVSHAIHEWLLRSGVNLPDTQDDDILKAGSPDATKPKHKELIKNNLADCLPHINKINWETKQVNLLVGLLAVTVKLLVVLVEKLKGNDLKTYAKEKAIKNGIDHRVLMATIQAESNWDPKAVGVNKNGSKDFGIVQINDEWWIGSNCKSAQKGEFYFPSSDYVLNNPKECIDWMISQWLKGRQNDWYAYRDGTYKLFLKNY